MISDSADIRQVLYSASMKHSDNILKKLFSLSGIADMLVWLVPILMCVPNVALSIVEPGYTPAERIANVALPWGTYTLLMSWSGHSGRSTLLLLPIMILCAFQIVLLYLYGRSIIAIDMFLNVATTNSREAGELLSNMSQAILSVCLLYLPPIVAAVILLKGKARSGKRIRRAAALTGATALAAGLSCVAVDFIKIGEYPAGRKLFPANVIHNIVTATERTAATARYFTTSAGFSFSAQAEKSAKAIEDEVYVLVIGETSRARNWQLMGYDRPTNPLLSERRNLLAYPLTLSESNTTHKSVPLLMSGLTSENFRDSIYLTKSIFTAFNEAGISTAWFSTQQRNRSFIDFFGDEAGETRFLVDDGKSHYDDELCDRLRRYVGSHLGQRLFIVLHTYGSHFNYRDRYLDDSRVFLPDEYGSASADRRRELINAYDNTIVATDRMLDNIIGILDKSGRASTMLYVSDHGEDIFDDSRLRFLHASPTPTYWQLHVPIVLWMSDSFKDAHPEKYRAAEANTKKNVSSSRSVFNTMLSLAGISAKRYMPEASLSDNRYTEPRRLYLNDYNESVPLSCCGMDSLDFRQLNLYGIK